MGEHRDIAFLLQQAEQARRSGQQDVAAKLWRQALETDPSNATALNGLGMQALARNDPAAETFFARATEADPAAAALWMNLATARRQRGDVEGERRALEGALATDQRHLMANLRMAELHERAGEVEAAAFRWSGVVAIIDAQPQRTTSLDEMGTYARSRIAAQTSAIAAKMEASLADARNSVPAVERRRFDACVDAMLGRRRIYHQEPHGLHFPFLPADEFFAAEHFPWLSDLRQAAPKIRQELEALLTAPDSGFAPYVEMVPGSPVNRWTPLDGSDAWSARYLWKYGDRQNEVCERCPETAAILASLPLAHIPGKGPTAFFSILKPGARLPAHSGVSNVRAIVHLPLIVPKNCGFRVGGEVRQWVEGSAFVFDDTIEHEAWNDSDEIRALLIFDTWNPHLSQAERDLLLQLFEALGKFGSASTALGAISD